MNKHNKCEQKKENFYSKITNERKLKDQMIFKNNVLSISPIKKDNNINKDITVPNIFQDNLEFAYKKESKELALCQNKEDCENLLTEIRRLDIDFLNLEQKYLLLQSIKTQEYSDKTMEIKALEDEINKAQDSIGKYQGKNLRNYEYTQLNEIEQNLLNLLIKAKEKKNTLQEIAINDICELELTSKCRVCEKNDYNLVCRPCNHICLCTDCVYSTLNCPECFEEIDYYDKIYLPE